MALCCHASVIANMLFRYFPMDHFPMNSAVMGDAENLERWLRSGMDGRYQI